MGPAPMEEIERTNVVVVRGLGAEAGQNVEVPPRRDPYAIEMDREGTVMHVEDSGIWPATVGIGEEGGR